MREPEAQGGGKRGKETVYSLCFVFVAGGQESCWPTGSTSEPASLRWPCSIEMLWLDQKKASIIIQLGRVESFFIV